MIEMFLRDRGIDYDMFVYQNGAFEYVTKNKNAKNNRLYKGLNAGTIIFDGVVLSSETATLDQIEYIKRNSSSI